MDIIIIWSNFSQFVIDISDPDYRGNCIIRATHAMSNYFHITIYLTEILAKIAHIVSGGQTCFHSSPFQGKKTK